MTTGCERTVYMIDIVDKSLSFFVTSMMYLRGLSLSFRDILLFGLKPLSKGVLYISFIMAVFGDG